MAELLHSVKTTDLYNITLYYRGQWLRPMIRPEQVGFSHWPKDLSSDKYGSHWCSHAGN